MTNCTMTKTTILTLLVAVAGCVPSLHAIFTDKDIVFDETLLGTWQHVDSGGKKDTWEFTKGKANAYHLAQTDTHGHRGQFEAHLAKVGEQKFLDIQPLRKEDVDTENGLYSVLSVPSHGFFLVDSLKPDFTIRSMNPEWLKKFLKDKPTAIAHEIVDGSIVLTADTKSLQSFATEHLKTPNAYGKPYTLKRAKE